MQFSFLLWTGKWTPLLTTKTISLNFSEFLAHMWFWLPIEGQFWKPDTNASYNSIALFNYNLHSNRHFGETGCEKSILSEGKEDNFKNEF